MGTEKSWRQQKMWKVTSAYCCLLVTKRLKKKHYNVKVYHSNYFSSYRKYKETNRSLVAYGCVVQATTLWVCVWSVARFNPTRQVEPLLAFFAVFSARRCKQNNSHQSGKLLAKCRNDPTKIGTEIKKNWETNRRSLKLVYSNRISAYGGRCEYLMYIFNTLCRSPAQHAPAQACKLTISLYLFTRWHLFRHVGYVRHQTFWPWKWCPNHVWRGLSLCQF